jgi:hypothetical protein
MFFVASPGRLDAELGQNMQDEEIWERTQKTKEEIG